MNYYIKMLLYAIAESVLITVATTLSSTYNSVVFILIAALCFAALFFTFFVWLSNVKARQPEAEMSPFWQRMLRLGRRLNLVPTACAPNSHYSDKQEIERRAHLQLPDFKVLSCEEMGSKENLNGRMEIEFCDDFSPATREKLCSLLRRNKVVIKMGTGVEERWDLQLSPDSRKGTIYYSYTASFIY